MNGARQFVNKETSGAYHVTHLGDDTVYKQERTKQEGETKQHDHHVKRKPKLPQYNGIPETAHSIRTKDVLAGLQARRILGFCSSLSDNNNSKQKHTAVRKAYEIIVALQTPTDSKAIHVVRVLATAERSPVY